MSHLSVKVERQIAAPPQLLYQLIADYNTHHFNFVPPALSDLKIEAGGIGAGTIITFKLSLLGTKQNFRVRIDEPIPGQVLTETNVATGAVTTFMIRPATGGSFVTIEASWVNPNFVSATFERLFLPLILKPLFHDELARLDSYAISVSKAGEVPRT